VPLLEPGQPALEPGRRDLDDATRFLHWTQMFVDKPDIRGPTFTMGVRSG
jgi:hypothetical protein